MRYGAYSSSEVKSSSDDEVKEKSYSLSSFEIAGIDARSWWRLRWWNAIQLVECSTFFFDCYFIGIRIQYKYHRFENHELGDNYSYYVTLIIVYLSTKFCNYPNYPGLLFIGQICLKCVPS